MKTYRLTSKDIKELNRYTLDQAVKELEKLLNIKRGKKHE
tara:strand:+ start:32537 stop:32656 length:120 start_codon:yes stop_codon:yes gene_type:complete